MANTENNILPSHASVVVIGGGVMGCSTLYHLAKGVTDAILLERIDHIWHNQFRGYGHCVHHNDGSHSLFIKLYGSLGSETGQPVGWINKGSYRCHNSDRMVSGNKKLWHVYLASRLKWSRQRGKKRWPLMRSDDVLGAVWSPDDSRVSLEFMSGFDQGAKSRGARIFEQTAVTGIQTKNGRICGVETKSGVIKTEKIALCTGLWSRRAAAMAGVEVPVWPCEHFYLLTKPLPGISGNLPTLSDHDGHLYIRDDSGGLLVGCLNPWANRSIRPFG